MHLARCAVQRRWRARSILAPLRRIAIRTIRRRRVHAFRLTRAAMHLRKVCNSKTPIQIMEIPSMGQTKSDNNPSESSLHFDWRRPGKYCVHSKAACRDRAIRTVVAVLVPMAIRCIRTSCRHFPAMNLARCAVHRIGRARSILAPLRRIAIRAIRRRRVHAFRLARAAMHLRTERRSITRYHGNTVDGSSKNALQNQSFA